MMRRALGAAGVTVLALTMAACGSDSGSQQSEQQQSEPSDAPAAHPLLPAMDTSQALPPNDMAFFRRIYDPLLESMGLRLSYGKLQDPNDGYKESPTGTHLALYAQPIGAYDPAQYVEGMWTVTAIMTPDVFARWSGLESWDICQLPTGVEVDPADPPAAMTQIAMTRDQAAAIDWGKGDVVDLLVAKRLDQIDIVNVSSAVRMSPPYQAADAAAKTRAAGSSTTAG